MACYKETNRSGAVTGIYDTPQRDNENYTYTEITRNEYETILEAMTPRIRHGSLITQSERLAAVEEVLLELLGG